VTPPKGHPFQGVRYSVETLFSNSDADGVQNQGRIAIFIRKPEAKLTTTLGNAQSVSNGNLDRFRRRSRRAPDRRDSGQPCRAGLPCSDP